MEATFTVQQRGSEFFVVLNSDILLTKEYGPHPDIATANSDAQAKATALEATRNTTNDLDIHVVEFPV